VHSGKKRDPEEHLKRLKAIQIKKEKKKINDAEWRKARRKQLDEQRGDV